MLEAGSIILQNQLPILIPIEQYYSEGTKSIKAQKRNLGLINYLAEMDFANMKHVVLRTFSYL